MSIKYAKLCWMLDCDLPAMSDEVFDSLQAGSELNEGFRLYPCVEVGSDIYLLVRSVEPDRLPIRH
jgi:hypothetical protein